MKLRALAAASVVLSLGAATVASATGSAPVEVPLRSYLAQHGLASPSAAAAVATGAAYTAPGMRVTPRAVCGPGSAPETGRQGRVSAEDHASGRAAKGFRCNTTEVAHFGSRGGFQVHRYVDKAGRDCAYYDSTLLFPGDLGDGDPGVWVLDMTNPVRPKRTAVLGSYGMSTPHESLRLNAERGLLVAAGGSPFTQAGVVDVYDVSGDCRTPVLKSSLPLAVYGHEGGFSPDGRTYWATSTYGPGITAIDLTNPSVPVVLYRDELHSSHGVSLSPDGNRLYITDVSGQFPGSTLVQGGSGMRVLDVSDIQARKPVPQVREVSFLTWPEATIAQNTNWFISKGRKYLLEYDEYDSNVFRYSPDEEVGAARIIDITDERRPRVVSRMRLAVHEKAARATDQRDDPGAGSGTQGYAAHYCNIPRQVEPGIVACSMITSGLRVFDVRDPLRPKEVAYHVRPGPGGAQAMSAPAFVPQRREVWYTDASSGFWSVRLSESAWPASSRR